MNMKPVTSAYAGPIPSPIKDNGKNVSLRSARSNKNEYKLPLCWLKLASMVLVLAVITNIFEGKCSSKSKSDRHRIAIETDFPVPLRKFINAARERANLELWMFGTQGTCICGTRFLRLRNQETAEIQIATCSNAVLVPIHGPNAACLVFVWQPLDWQIPTIHVRGIK